MTCSCGKTHYSLSDFWRSGGHNPNWKDTHIEPWVRQELKVGEGRYEYFDICRFCGTQTHTPECKTLTPYWYPQPVKTGGILGSGGFYNPFSTSGDSPGFSMPTDEDTAEKIKQQKEAIKKKQEELEKKIKALIDYLEPLQLELEDYVLNGNPSFDNPALRKWKDFELYFNGMKTNWDAKYEEHIDPTGLVLPYETFRFTQKTTSQVLEYVVMEYDETKDFEILFGANLNQEVGTEARIKTLFIDWKKEPIKNAEWDNYWGNIKTALDTHDVPSEKIRRLNHLRNQIQAIKDGGEVLVKDRKKKVVEAFNNKVLGKTTKPPKPTPASTGNKKLFAEWYAEKSITKEEFDKLLLVVKNDKQYTLDELKKLLTTRAETIRERRLISVRKEVSNFLTDWRDLLIYTPNPITDFQRKDNALIALINVSLIQDDLIGYEDLMKQHPILFPGLGVKTLTDNIAKWKIIEADYKKYSSIPIPKTDIEEDFEQKKKSLNTFILTPDTWRTAEAAKLKVASLEAENVWWDRWKTELNKISQNITTHTLIIQQTELLITHFETNSPDPTAVETNEVINRLKELKTKVFDPTQIDTGWLTDDNIEYILEHHPKIQEALTKRNVFGNVWKIHDDIANVHFVYEASKKSIPRDPAFQDSINMFSAYLDSNPYIFTIFPLRVMGNHWGLLVIQRLGGSGNKFKAFYTSSSRGNLILEKTTVEPFLDSISSDPDTARNLKIVYSISRQNDGYNCGVYMIKYILEMLEEAKPDKLNKTITFEDCQEFRREWKQKIINDGGAWCA